jgi:hypothetical protein
MAAMRLGHEAILCFVIPGRAESANFDVQLHIRESIATIVSMGSGFARITCAPGTTAQVCSNDVLSSPAATPQAAA